MKDSDLRRLPGGEAALGFLSQRSEITADSYRYGLAWFLEWCQRHDHEPTSLRPVHFDVVRREMTQRWKPRGVALRQTAISGFYKYLVERGEIDTSPVPDGWRVKLDRETPEAPPLDWDQLGRFKSAAMKAGGKDAVIVVLIVDLWMRVGEVCNAAVEHFDITHDGAVEVSGTAFGTLVTSRRLTGPEAATIREHIGTRSSGPFLTTEWGTPLNRSAVSRVLDRVATAAGVNRVSANDLRRSALAHSILGFRGELRPSRLRRIAESAESTLSVSEVDPAEFAKQLVAISDVLLEDARTRPVAPVVLTGTAVEYFLRRLALAAESTSGGGGIEAWSGALRSLNVISKQEKKTITVWSGYRDIAVHDDDTSPLTVAAAQRMNAEFLEFVERHEARFSPNA